MHVRSFTISGNTFARDIMIWSSPQLEEGQQSLSDNRSYPRGLLGAS